MSGHPVTALAAAALAIGLCAGCVTPAPTTDVFEAKAGLTAQDANSSAATAVLAVRTYESGKLTPQALEVLLEECEDGLGSVTSTFDSVQPPDTDAADALRSQLDDLLADAGDATSTLRIAARRGDTGTLREAAGSLQQVTDRLDAFAKEHSQ
jgi:hypothetical protein